MHSVPAGFFRCAPAAPPPARRSRSSCAAGHQRAASVCACAERSPPTSLDHLGDEVQTGSGERCIQLVALVTIGLGDLIRPQSLRQARQRVRHRRDVAGIGALERTDEFEDPREALLVDGNFLCRELEPRQSGDARDLLACESHGSTWRTEKTRPKSYMLPCSMSPRLLD